MGRLATEDRRTVTSQIMMLLKEAIQAREARQ
jgi:hypothetical protein